MRAKPLKQLVNYMLHLLVFVLFSLSCETYSIAVMQEFQAALEP